MWDDTTGDPVQSSTVSASGTQASLWGECVENAFLWGLRSLWIASHHECHGNARARINDRCIDHSNLHRRYDGKPIGLRIG